MLVIFGLSRLQVDSAVCCRTKQVASLKGFILWSTSDGQTTPLLLLRCADSPSPTAEQLEHIMVVLS